MKKITDLDYHVGDIVQIKPNENAGRLGKIERITAPGGKPFFVYTVRIEKTDGIEFINVTNRNLQFISREE